MPLGIGGGVFGARGGISTRGVGVGVGPLSAGTSWRGKNRPEAAGSLLGCLPLPLSSSSPHGRSYWNLHRGPMRRVEPIY